ncbi:unnamed protein product [Musa textilis]
MDGHTSTALLPESFQGTRGHRGADGDGVAADQGAGDRATVAARCVPLLGDVHHARRREGVHGRRHRSRQALRQTAREALQVGAHARRPGARQLSLPHGPRANPHVQRKGGLPALHRSCMWPLLAIGSNHNPSARRFHRPSH